MNMEQLAPRIHDRIHAITETPAYSRHKYTYDPELDLFRVKKTLPVGACFPFDFGFIPNTRAADGDPLDILVLTEERTFPGCLLECRALGIIEAEQEKGEDRIRNDRIVAVHAHATLYSDLSSVGDLGKHLVEQLEAFFTNYNRSEGKMFQAIRWSGVDRALRMIDKYSTGTFSK
jgi:inorganic pyrophosphatase